MAYSNNMNNNKSMIDFCNDVKDQQMKVLQETIRNLQTQLLDNKTKEKENLMKIVELESKLKQANVKELLLKTKIVEATKISPPISVRPSDIIDESDPSIVCVDDDDENDVNNHMPITIVSANANACKLNQTKGINADEAQLISLVATFLVVHPFGASLDYIYSYVQRTSTHLRPKELEEILCRYTSIFREEVNGIGAKIERKWKFCGFDKQHNSCPTVICD